MAASFQRALYKLNVEHQLDLHDPDLAEDPCGNSFDLQLCRDAKDLWQYHHDRWEYVVNRFSTQAPGVRSQWVSKPHGDPTTISFGATSQIATLKDLFRGLLLEEKVRCKMAIFVHGVLHSCWDTDMFQLRYHQQSRFPYQRNQR